MQWGNAPAGYGLVQIVLHWLVAGTIFVMLPLGLWMTGLDYYDPWSRRGPDLHRATGILLGLVLMVRILWRLGWPVPRSLSELRWQRRVAATTHALLYLLPFALILSGYLLSTADGRAITVFGWFEVPATLYGMDHQEDIAGEIHFALAMVLIAVILLHAAAALRHHLQLGDDTLRRMLRPHPQNNDGDRP